MADVVGMYYPGVARKPAGYWMAITRYAAGQKKMKLRNDSGYTFKRPSDLRFPEIHFRFS
jgi:hypothetical protein